LVLLLVLLLLLLLFECCICIALSAGPIGAVPSALPPFGELKFTALKYEPLLLLLVLFAVFQLLFLRALALSCCSLLSPLPLLGRDVNALEGREWVSAVRLDVSGVSVPSLGRVLLLLLLAL
jgi:hypothetical protein